MPRRWDERVCRDAELSMMGADAAAMRESRDVVMEVRKADSLSVNPGPRPGLG